MDNHKERYSEYLKQFQTEVSKEVDIDIDAQKSPNKALPVGKRDRNSPFNHSKKS